MINAMNRCKRRELKARRRRPSRTTSTAPSSRTSSLAGDWLLTQLLLLGIGVLRQRFSPPEAVIPLARVDDKFATTCVPTNCARRWSTRRTHGSPSRLEPAIEGVVTRLYTRQRR